MIERQLLVENSLHDLGYDVFSIPELHASERRRLAEGKRIRGELQRERREQQQNESGSSAGQRTNVEGDLLGESRRRQRKQRSKRRRIEQYARKHDLRQN